MEDITNFEFNTLLDMLASYTNKYMKMLREGTAPEEYERCKNMINRLSIEIETRKRQKVLAKSTGTPEKRK